MEGKRESAIGREIRRRGRENCEEEKNEPDEEERECE